MVRTIRRRLALGAPEAGISLVEVLVALMVFSIIAIGMSYSLLSVQRLTADNKNREVASNLASAEIDRVLALGDPFQVTSDPNIPKRVGGVDYRIDRQVQWQTDSNIATTDTSCGTGGGNLLYKSVNVRVSWDGMFVLRNPVRADTILAPEDRINTPNFGTILVSAFGADGTGRSGVNVSITPKAGSAGAPVDSVPKTNSDGCSFALRVTPGYYTVVLSRTNYLDTAQNATPTEASLKVDAGATSSLSFQYDERVRLSASYRSNQPTAKLPSSLDSSFFADGKVFTGPIRASADLHPFRDGYTAAAGRYTRPSSSDPLGCTNVNPESWSAGKVGDSDKAAGVAARASATAPGSSGSIEVPMGIVNLALPVAGTVTATSAAAADVGYPGDPGCSTAGAMTYVFPGLQPGSTPLALPWGSWTLRYSSLRGPTVQLNSTTLSVSDHGRVTGTVVTLDPREDE